MSNEEPIYTRGKLSDSADIRRALEEYSARKLKEAEVREQKRLERTYAIERLITRIKKRFGPHR